MTATSTLLKELHVRFGSQVGFVTLYVREAHPGERQDQPRTPQEKALNAKELKICDGISWPVAVDDLDGTVHRALDEKPNAAYLTDRHGRIVFRALWAGDADALAKILESIVRRNAPPRRESSRRLIPMARGLSVMRDVLHQAGPRASVVALCICPTLLNGWWPTGISFLPHRQHTMANAPSSFLDHEATDIKNP